MRRYRSLGITMASFALLLGPLTGQVTKPKPANPEQGENRSEQYSASEESFPVQLDHRTLITVGVPLAGYSAKERAEAVQARLEALATNRTIPVSAITAEDHQYWSQIKAGQEDMMYVSEWDAQHAGFSRHLLAAQNAEIFRHAIARYRAEHTWPNFLRGVLYSILVTAGLIFLGFVLSRMYYLQRTMLERWVATSEAKLATHSKFRVPGAYLGPPVLMLAGVLRWVVFLVLLNFYFTLVLGFFAATREISRSLSAWFVSFLSDIAEQFVNYLPNLLIVATIALITYYLIRLNGFFFGEVGAGQLSIRGFYPDWAGPTSKLIRALIIILAAVIIFPYLPGSKSPAFQGISIFVGLLLSLGSTSAVANAVAGTILTYMRSFQVGDFVKVGDTRGKVIDKTLLVTRICTPKQEIVTIPNGNVMSASVTNYSVQAAQRGVILYTTVTIGYDAPWRQVHNLLINAASATKNILKDPKPFVLQTSLDDFYVSYQLNVYTDEPLRMQQIYSELHENIQDMFNESGVEIMSPHYSQLRDGNQTTIPENYLPDDYEASRFRIQSISDNGVSTTRKVREIR